MRTVLDASSTREEGCFGLVHSPRPMPAAHHVQGQVLPLLLWIKRGKPKPGLVMRFFGIRPLLLLLSEGLDMTIERPIRADRPGRKWTRIGLLAIGWMALCLEGCSSFGNGCGTTRTGFASRLANCNLSQKLFHRRATPMAVDSCDPSLGMSTMEAAGTEVIVPGPVLTTPPLESEPNILPNPTGTGATPATSSNLGSGKSVSQAQQQNTRGEAMEARREVSKPSSIRDPLADLPALSIPPYDAPPETSPPTPPSAGDRPAAEVPTLAQPKPSATASGLAPGIRRFKVIEPRLSAGSLPNDMGWTWLVNLGYRTVVDLREPTEVLPEEIAEINHHGLQYLSIPTSKLTVDADRLKQFEDAVSKDEVRPVFVFDADGARPASLAYLHLVLTKKTDRALAERKVEDLGANESALWAATKLFLDSKKTSEGTSSTTQNSKKPPEIEPSAVLETQRVGLVTPIEAPGPTTPSTWTRTAAAVMADLNVAVSLGVRALANLPATATPPSSVPHESGG